MGLNQTKIESTDMNVMVKFYGIQPFHIEDKDKFEVDMLNHPKVLDAQRKYVLPWLIIFIIFFAVILILVMGCIVYFYKNYHSYKEDTEKITEQVNLNESGSGEERRQHHHHKSKEKIQAQAVNQSGLPRTTSANKLGVPTPSLPISKSQLNMLQTWRRNSQNPRTPTAPIKSPAQFRELLDEYRKYKSTTSMVPVNENKPGNLTQQSTISVFVESPPGSPTEKQSPKQILQKNLPPTVKNESKLTKNLNNGIRATQRKKLQRVKAIDRSVSVASSSKSRPNQLSLDFNVSNQQRAATKTGNYSHSRSCKNDQLKRRTKSIMHAHNFVNSIDAYKKYKHKNHHHHHKTNKSTDLNLYNIPENTEIDNIDLITSSTSAIIDEKQKVVKAKQRTIRQRKSIQSQMNKLQTLARASLPIKTFEASSAKENSTKKNADQISESFKSSLSYHAMNFSSTPISIDLSSDSSKVKYQANDFFQDKILDTPDLLAKTPVTVIRESTVKIDTPEVICERVLEDS